MKVDVISTFSPAYYDTIAKFFVKSCIEHLSDSVNLKLYVDDLNIPTGRNFQLFDLEKTVPDLKEFKERNKNRSQDGWRSAAITFSHKVYATWHAAKNTDADILVWLDADTELLTRIDKEYFTKFLPLNLDIGYLGRNSITETGFIVFNLKNSNTHNFLDVYKDLYDSDKLFDHKQWHDGYIFDRVREDLEGKGVLNTQNISPAGIKKSHFNNLHKGFIMHHKGDDKEKRNAI